MEHYAVIGNVSNKIHVFVNLFILLNIHCKKTFSYFIFYIRKIMNEYF